MGHGHEVSAQDLMSPSGRPGDVLLCSPISDGNRVMSPTGISIHSLESAKIRKEEQDFWQARDIINGREEMVEKASDSQSRGKTSPRRK